MTTIAASRSRMTMTAERVKALAPTRHDLVDAGFLGALTLLAMLTLETTFDNSLYLAAGALGLLLGMGVAHVANVLRQPILVLAALVLVVYFLIGGVVAVRDRTLVGVVPTSASVTGLSSLAVTGWKDLLTTLPPVDGAGQLIVLPYLLGLLAGTVGFTVARRTRSIAACLVVPLTALALMILLGTRAPSAAAVVGVGTAALSCTWVVARARRRLTGSFGGGAKVGQRARRLTGAALLVLAGAATVGLAPILTGAHARDRVVLRSYVEPPFDPTTYPSPMAGFRKYTEGVKLLWDQTLLTVQGLPADTRLRFATLDAYSGTAWAAGATANDPGRPDTYQRVGTAIEQPGLAGTATYSVSIEPAYAAVTDLNVWLPAAGPATRVEFTGGTAANHTTSFRYNLAASQGLVPDRLRAGDVVRISGGVLAPVDANFLAGSGVTADPTTFAFLAPQAAKWGGGEGSSWKQLTGVAGHLRSTGAYSDGTASGETQYLPGHGVGRLVKFVNGKQAVGNDEQYAATVALLANQLGVPARVVLGALVPVDGKVRGKDVHAWVEVYAADGTWHALPHTAFMPDRSKKPDQQEPDPIQDLNAQVVPPPAASRPPGSTDILANADAGAQGTTPEPPVSSFRLPQWALTALRLVGFPVGILVAFGSVVILAKWVRRRRRRRRGSATTRLAAGWQELVDRATDLGMTLPVETTRREQGRLLTGAGLAELADTADAGVFGPGEPTESDIAAYWHRVATARKQMGAAHPTRTRLRAAVSLRSFLARAATRTPRPRPSALKPSRRLRKAAPAPS